VETSGIAKRSRGNGGSLFQGGKKLNFPPVPGLNVAIGEHYGGTEHREERTWEEE